MDSTLLLLVIQFVSNFFTLLGCANVNNSNDNNSNDNNNNNNNNNNNKL